MQRHFLAVVLAVLTLPFTSYALTTNCDLSSYMIGMDGTDGVDSQSNTGTSYTISFNSSILLISKLHIDFSAFGTGLGLGVDLSNVDSGDISLAAETTLGLPVGIFGSPVVDNINKTIEIILDFPIALSSNGILVINDIQNAPFPFSRHITVSTDNLLNLLNDTGFCNLSFTGGHADGDLDRLPDGFEIYYGIGSFLGDEDANASKNALLHPSQVNDFTDDFDSDGMHNLREFLGGTHPGNPGSTPSTLDSDSDNIYDVDESFPGISLDTDGDGTPDALDTDSDNDGILDIVEAGKDPESMVSMLHQDPVDTDNDRIPDFQDLDSDNDGVLDAVDNCRVVLNTNQADNDADGIGDACDDDDDNDGVLDNAPDNCIFVPNPNQNDTDMDNIGDACEDDIDGDGILDGNDNCPYVANPIQGDIDLDGLGDACDADSDNDGVEDSVPDNCLFTPNPNQNDLDQDNIGDACEDDTDGDSILDEDDNCIMIPNFDQVDTDQDSIGDSCDNDDDNDGILDFEDNCPVVSNAGQDDLDGDGTGDACEDDTDGDTILNQNDNCPLIPNVNQLDNDQDGMGDICDNDDDNDNISDAIDNCQFDGNTTQLDIDENGVGDACDIVKSDISGGGCSNTSNQTDLLIVLFVLLITLPRWRKQFNLN